ncbi:MAG TPA: pilin [Xanthomonadales bacterium]|nr:pilin [Xanthomonadales bacterium]
MKKREKGFGGLQVLLLASIIGAAALLVVSKHQAVTNKAKITEAINLASESKRRIARNYMVSGSFPRTAQESKAMFTGTSSQPEHVRDMKIEHNRFGDSVTIKVFLNDDVVEGDPGEDQYVYISGFRTQGGEYEIEWQCGGIGIGPEMLPEDCQG